MVLLASPSNYRNQYHWPFSGTFRLSHPCHFRLESPSASSPHHHDPFLPDLPISLSLLHPLNLLATSTHYGIRPLRQAADLTFRHRRSTESCHARHRRLFGRRHCNRGSLSDMPKINQSRTLDEQARLQTNVSFPIRTFDPSLSMEHCSVVRPSLRRPLPPQISLSRSARSRRCALLTKHHTTPRFTRFIGVAQVGQRFIQRSRNDFAHH